MKKQQATLFCIGYGDTSKAVADILRPRGWQVVATSRSEEKAARLKAEGVTGIVFGDHGDWTPPAGAHWLISTPPDEDGCPGFREFGKHAASAGWLGYLSTTGVYGDLDGGWAFEWTTRSPDNKRGERRVEAEDAWWSVREDTNVFRLPGIYGPGRSQLDRLKDGDTKRIVKPGQVFSRIMVSDIASCVAAAIDRDLKGQVLHPCDDEPAPPQDAITFAAELLGMELPPETPFDEADLSPMARGFYSECKRVSNARTKSLTGWLPEFSDYRAGLKHLAALQDQN